LSRKRPLRSLRFRIAVAFLLGALVVSGFVAGSTYGLAHAFLTRQRINSITRQSFNALRSATDYLSDPGRVTSPEQLADRLVALLRTRGGTDVLLVDGDRSIASSVSITTETVPLALQHAVARGNVGHMTFGTGPALVAFGSPIPNSTIEAFFVYPLDQLEATLSLLRRILVAVSVAAVGMAGGLGLRLASQMTQPLARVSEASRRVAEGVLETRLEETGEDELGSLAASFNEMARALQERIAREQRFVADASHELRTPLTALKASIDYLVDHGSDLPEGFRSSAQLAAREVGALHRLVDDLLELSRMEMGVADVRRDEFELGDFAREVVRRRGDGKVDAPEGPAEGLVVRSDKLRLERVVGNLVENAVVHGLAQDVGVAVALRDGRPSIVVSDRGPGMPSEDLARIFEPFWRGDQARRRVSSSGSGLGLAIARENAVLLGADIQVLSSSAGTSFTVLLPSGTYIGPRPAGEP
jgi:two-component system sensor histidine kinase MtrB